MTGEVIFSTILDKKVLSIELKNPSKNNAISINMLDTIANFLSKKEACNKFKVIVFRGFKDSGFSAGADLNEIKSLENKNSLNIYHKKLNKLLKILANLETIKISIIKSYCIGAGFILAMNTDICIANKGCIFAIPASKLNIKLPTNQLDFLIKKFPNNVFLSEVILTGRKFTASEAYNSQLINKLFKDENFSNDAIKYLENFVVCNEKMYKYYFKKFF